MTKWGKPYFVISIHAPTGGATYVINPLFNAYTISIHAPTGGATFSLNSLYTDLWIISIHAPTGGATSRKALNFWERLFQSTLPQGERPSRFLMEVKKYQFQSTLPQGERLQKCTKTIRFLHSAFIKFTQSNEQLQYIF